MLKKGYNVFIQKEVDCGSTLLRVANSALNGNVYLMDKKKTNVFKIVFLYFLWSVASEILKCSLSCERL